MRARVPVFEIMSQTPVTIAPHATVAEACAIMRDREIGSLIVVEDGRPTGIVTERDVVTKVAALDRLPREVSVRSVMTSPVVAIHPDEEVAEAARTMAARKIRRLAVVLEVTREYARAGLEDRFSKGIEGHCETCGVYATTLVWDRDLLSCADCRAG